MKKIKALLCILLGVIFSLCLFACGDSETSLETPETTEEPGSTEEPGDTEEPNEEEEKIVLALGINNKGVEHHGRTVDVDVYIPKVETFPIVIFSHGYNGYKDDFKASAEMLMRKNIGAITLTFCGSGARDTSTLATTEMTLCTEKEDLLAVMDYAKKIEGFNGDLFLLGGSQGGMVTAMAAEERADEIKGMILLYPGFSIPDDWNSRYPNDAAVPEVIPWWGVDLGRDFVLTLRYLDIYMNMSSFTKPVLLMHATDDDIVPVSYSERAATIYPNVKFKKYSSGGHGFLPADKELLGFINDCLFGVI